MENNRNSQHLYDKIKIINEMDRYRYTKSTAQISALYDEIFLRYRLLSFRNITTIETVENNRNSQHLGDKAKIPTGLDKYPQNRNTVPISCKCKHFALFYGYFKLYPELGSHG